MPRLPKGAHYTSINGVKCASIARRTLAAFNSNVSFPCGSAQPFSVLDDTSASVASTVPKIQNASSAPPSHSDIVMAGKATSYLEPHIPSSVNSAPAPTPSSSSSISSTQAVLYTLPASSVSASISLPSATVTVQSAFTATPVSTSSHMMTSTSEWSTIRQNNISRSNPASISPPASAQPTTDNNASSITSSTSKPGENHGPQSNTHQGQQSTGESSPTIRPPAQQVENPAQPSAMFPSTTQRVPSNQVPRPDVPVASNFPQSSSSSSEQSRASIPPAILTETAGANPASIGVVAPALPKSLEISSLSLPFEGSEEQYIPETNLPIETARDPVLASPSPDITPVGDLHGRPGHTKPGAGPADSSHHSGSRLSPEAIAGISIGVVIGLAITAFVVWFAKRRSKRGTNRTGSLIGDGGEDPSSRSGAPAAIRKQRIGNPRSGFGKMGLISYPTIRERSIRANQAATTDMAERRMRSVFKPAQLRNGPSTSDIGEESQIGLANPFSDQNAIDLLPQISSLPPITLFFSAPSSGQVKRDANGVPLETSAPRGRSLSGAKLASQYSASSATATGPHSVHRISVQSIDPPTNKRNKFRSDPFDLEIDSRLIPSGVSISVMPPQTAASLAYSGSSVNNSSRYTSGVSMSEWSISGESRPYDPVSVAPSLTNQFVAWDSPHSSNALKPGDLEQLPTTVEQPQIMFGQAL